MSQLCKKIRVSGKVQGVFFRAFTQQVAQALQLTGWTCNEPDGSVLVFACGEGTQLDKLIDALHQGPPAAQVSAVEVQAEPVQEMVGFIIKR